LEEKKEKISTSSGLESAPSEIIENKREFKDDSSSNTMEGTDEAQILKEQLQQLQEQKLCKICMDAEINTVFLPCGHLVACLTCTKDIKQCPVCRQEIAQTVRIFS